MAIIVEGYLDGKKVSYDMIKFHHALVEALVKKGVLTKGEIEALYKKSR